MNDPFSRFTLPVVLFLVGLLVFMGLVYFADRASASVYYVFSNGGTNLAVYGNRTGGSGIVYTGFQYTPTSTFSADTVSIEIVKSGTPTTTGETIVTLREGGTNPDDGVLLATTSKSNAFTLGANCNDDNFVDFVFDYPQRFVSGTTYFFRVENTVNEGISPSRNLCSDNVAPDWQYATSWINGAGNASYKIGTYSGTGIEQIHWRFPNDGDTLPDPSKYVVYFSGLDINTFYYIGIHSYLATSTVTSSENGTEFWDYAGINGVPWSIFYGVEKKSRLDWIPHGDRVWQATVNLCLDAHCNVILDSESITFTVNFSSTVPNAPFADGAGPFTAANDALYGVSGENINDLAKTIWNKEDWCGEPPGGWLDTDKLSWAFCKSLETLFRPSDESYAWLLESIGGVKDIYPMKFLFDFADRAKEKVNSLAGESTPTLSLNMNTAFGREDATFVLLSSSTLSAIAPSSTVTSVRDVSGYVIWFSLVGILIKILFL